MSEFSDPQRVTIQGYNNDVMEPFISHDGQYLFFNNRNDSSVNTNLYYAKRIDGLTFQFQGEIAGVNTPSLEAVPSMDRDGNFYFVSNRSYNSTLSTIYRGKFKDGRISNIELVPGISRKRPGMVNFDVEVSADGNTLYFVDSQFGLNGPQWAKLVIAQRQGLGFKRLSNSDDLLRYINTGKLQYAPCISEDGLELFFTRVNGGLPDAGIYRSVRGSTADAFGVPEKVRAIEGFVEAPALSSDGKSLYYHKKDGLRYSLYRVVR